MLDTAPTDNFFAYIMESQSDLEKLSEWVNSGVSFNGFEFKIPEDVSDIALMVDWTPIGTESAPLLYLSYIVIAVICDFYQNYKKK